MINADYCRRIICGAVSQREAGYQDLLECANAGYVGALPCNHPECAPYKDETPCRVSVINEITVSKVTNTPPSVEVDLPIFSPLDGRPVATFTAPDLVPVMPSIVEKPFVNTVIDHTEQRRAIRNDVCRINNWVSANPVMAVVMAAVVFGALGGFKGRTA